MNKKKSLILESIECTKMEKEIKYINKVININFYKSKECNISLFYKDISRFL